MKAKLFTIILTITISIGETSAATKIGDLYYNLSATSKTAEVTYSGSYSGDIIIPTSVEYDLITYSVTVIGYCAFSNCTNLSSITIPNSVTYIADYAFKQCTSLTSINIPESVEEIGKGAFEGCSGLTSVAISNGVKCINAGAFQGCTGLKSVHISDIAAWCEIGYTDLKTSYTGNPLYYAKHLYLNENEITNLIIPNNVRDIGRIAFYNCSSITSVTIPYGVKGIGSRAFYNCSSLTSVTIPNSVENINDDAFCNCTGLTSVTIGTKVTSIKNGAFDGCSSIKSVIWNAKNCSKCSGFPNNVTTFTFGNEVESIPANCCKDLNKLTSMMIPYSVISIGADAFYGCSNITSVIWNAKNCNSWNFGKQVESFIFGDSVEVIPANCCNAMDKLTAITIPQSVTSIGENAFNGCGSKIASLVFPSSLKSIGEYAFKDWTKIKQINIPNGVETIGAHAFDSCIFVTSIYLGNAVSEIGDYAFKGCIRVNDITSMNTVTPVVYENTLTSISPYAYLYVQAGSKRTYQLDPYWSRFDIREITSEETMVTRDAVTVEANEDNAIFTWPVVDNAATYSLQITKDGVVFCALTFNANGQLVGIAFVTGRDRQAHAPAATMTTVGMQFTVTGLDIATNYAFSLIVKGDNGNVLRSYSGTFGTTGAPEAIENVQDNKHSTKILHNGQILILCGDKTYTITGQEIK